MASLAILVAFMFLFVILIGPIAFLTSRIRFLPTFISVIISCIAILVGFLWLTMPIGIVRILGIAAIYLGYISLPFSKK